MLGPDKIKKLLLQALALEGTPVVPVPHSGHYLNVNFYHAKFVDQAMLFGWLHVLWSGKAYTIFIYGLH